MREYATFHFIENSIDDDVARAKASRENSARPAIAELTYISTGVGQQRVSTPLVFPVIFRNEPHLSTASAVVANPKPKIWNDPIGQCGVWQWQRDQRGFFTGAWIWWRTEVYLITETDPVPAPPTMRVQHFLSFSGTAFKDLPRASLDPSLPTRSTGI